MNLRPACPACSYGKVTPAQGTLAVTPNVTFPQSSKGRACRETHARPAGRPPARASGSSPSETMWPTLRFCRVPSLLTSTPAARKRHEQRCPPRDEAVVRSRVAAGPGGPPPAGGRGARDVPAAPGTHGPSQRCLPTARAGKRGHAEVAVRCDTKDTGHAGSGTPDGPMSPPPPLSIPHLRAQSCLRDWRLRLRHVSLGDTVQPVPLGKFEKHQPVHETPS